MGWNKGFESTENHLIILNANDQIVNAPTGSKRQAADALLAEIAALRRES